MFKRIKNKISKKIKTAKILYKKGCKIDFKSFSYKICF